MRRYDATARIYDERYAEEQAAKIEAALKHVTPKAAKILDAGCGTGILFSYVADESQITVGLDVSKKTLCQAEKRARNHEHVQLVWADVDNMPLRDNVFDLVFAMTLLQNTPRKTKTLSEIRRVARESARIVVTGLKKIFTERVFKQLLKSAGLNVLAMENESLKCFVAVCIKD